MFGMPQPRRMWARITRDVVNNNKSNRNRRFRLMCLPIESRSAFSTIIPSPCRLCVHGKNKRLVCSTVSGYWLIIFSIVVILMLLLITHSSWENYSDEIIWFSGAAKCTKEWRRHQRWVEQYFSHEEKKKLQLMMITISGGDAWFTNFISSCRRWKNWWIMEKSKPEVDNKAGIKIAKWIVNWLCKVEKNWKHSRCEWKVCGLWC